MVAAGAEMGVVAIKVDKIVIIVSAGIGSLGLLSAVLGFAGDGAKHTNNCTSAVGLGVCAAVFLLIAEAAVSVVGACFGCFKSRGAIPSDTRRLVGVVRAVSSWIAAVVASVMFLVGAIQASSCSNSSTGVSAGIFSCAGLLTLLATGLGIASYIMLRRQPQPERPAVPEQSPNYQPYDSPPLAQGDGGQTPTAPPPQRGGHGEAPPPAPA